jgi:hypothetical protein
MNFARATAPPDAGRRARAEIFSLLFLLEAGKFTSTFLKVPVY